MSVEKKSENETMIVLPADHRIEDVEEFQRTLKCGECVAKEGNLVTFGICPDHPATGYGYIETGDEFQNGVFHVKQFHEKPAIDQAKAYINSGHFLWNSGMFMWTLAAIRDALLKFEVVDSKWFNIGNTQNLAEEIRELYANVKPQPIDVAIMEKASNRAVLPVDYGWSDVGSWRALHEISEKDSDGISGTEEHVLVEARNCHLTSGKLVALIGVEDLVIVDTPDVLLVAKREDSENVKRIVDILKAKGEDRYL
jgi:mannose-1-phosphate guanylyltransferase